MARTRAAFGIVMSVLPPAVPFHIFWRPASPIAVSFSFTVFTPASCAARMSAVDFGDGGAPSPLSTVSSSDAHPQIVAGDPATWRARSPSDIDFGCGFHVSLSVGTRSRTLRVVPASFSNSCRTALIMDMDPSSDVEPRSLLLAIVCGMRKLLIVAATCVATAGLLRAAGDPPAWAYAIPSPPPAGTAAGAPPAPDTSPKQLAGSTLTFTRQQISDGFGPADWFPGDHPPIPDIVAHGKRPDVRACGLCHYPNGKGRQENAGVSGLPVSYFIQQMNDFRDGLRKSAEPRKANTNLMAAYAKAMTPEEMQVAAEYFGAMPWTPWIRVVET